jgi:hypothetical protein
MAPHGCLHAQSWAFLERMTPTHIALRLTSAPSNVHLATLDVALSVSQPLSLRQRSQKATSAGCPHRPCCRWVTEVCHDKIDSS